MEGDGGLGTLPGPMLWLKNAALPGITTFFNANRCILSPAYAGGKGFEELF